MAGFKPDGSAKLRPADDFTKSGCNPATGVTEKLRYDSGDSFLTLLRSAHSFLGPSLSLWKTDIDSAFRRVPVEPGQRSFAWVAFICKGMALVALHLSMMFGSTSSVHHWDRIGTLVVASTSRTSVCCVLALQVLC